MNKNRKQFIVGLGLIAVGLLLACLPLSLAAAHVSQFDQLILANGYATSGIWVYGVTIVTAVLLLAAGTALTLRSRRSIAV